MCHNSETQILTHELRGNQLGVLILSETAGSFSSSSKRVAVVAVPAGYTTAQRNAVRYGMGTLVLGVKGRIWNISVCVNECKEDM